MTTPPLRKWSLRKWWSLKRSSFKHPFRTLLYLEWVLLAISLLNLLFIEIIDATIGLSTIEVSWQEQMIISFWSFWQSGALVVAFGVIGAWLPFRSNQKIYQDDDRDNAQNNSTQNNNLQNNNSQNNNPRNNSARNKKRNHHRRSVIYTVLSLFIVGTVGHLCFWDGMCLAPLLLIITIRSCLLFKKKGQIMVAIATLTLFSIANNISWRNAELIDTVTEESATTEIQSLPQLEIVQIQLQDAFLFSLVLVFVLLSIRALLAERKNRRKLASAHAQLYEYALRIENQATLQERNRIARDIHDALGHLLTAQSIQLDNGLLFLAEHSPKAQSFFQSSKQLGSEALKALRQSIATLRDHSLAEENLEEAITSTINNFQQITGMAIRCQVSIADELSGTIPTEISTAILRILEEALTNSHKHAQASQVTITLETQQRPNESPYLFLAITDNGIGFSVPQNATGFGLRGMHERAAKLGAHLTIESSPSAGCTLSGEFPLGIYRV